MKKLGLLLIFALVAHSALANEAGAAYPSMTFAVAEYKAEHKANIGANIHGAADLESGEASGFDAEQLKRMNEQTLVDVNSQLRKRISDSIKASWETNEF